MAQAATGVGEERRPPEQTTAAIAWSPRQELSAQEWVTAGRRIGAVGRSIQWLLGDWICYGNARFGERYARASKITGYDPQTLMNMVYVASRFSVSRRRENLSWSHHEALSSLDAEEQDRWLERAIAHRWSVADLRLMLRLERRKKETAGLEGEATVSLWPPGGEAAPGEPAGVITSGGSEVTCPRCGSRVPLSP